MMIFQKAIPRRTFLRGLGATVALPLLDSMIPAFAAGTKPVMRLGYVYSPNGRVMERWRPTGEGTAYRLSPSLEPIGPHRDKFLVLSGLNMTAADPRAGEPGGVHARPCAAFLTGIHPKPGGEMGVSVDQIVGRFMSNQTQLGSLELALESAEALGKGDGAYSDAYTKTISWRTGTQPLPMEANPRAVFERLLGGSTSTDPEVRRREARKNRSLLDSVTEEVASLMPKFGPSDRVRLTEYLDSIRDIERRIQLAEEQSSRELPEMDRPAGIPGNYSDHVQLMYDLQILAYRGDLTRVATLMQGPEQSDRPYREIGIADAHHQLSHHAGNPEWIDKVGKIDHFHVQMFVNFIEKLAATPDGDGTLFDHSIMVFGSGLSDGMWHNHNDLPVLVAGGAGGAFKGGRHIHYDGVPFSNLHLTVLDLMGVPSEPFLDAEDSDATGKLEHLTL